MYKQIYPVIGDEKNLPFYVVGLGLESWQFPIKRAKTCFSVTVLIRTTS